MLRVEKELFQWEKGRYVVIDSDHPEVLTVEFYNSKSANTKETLVQNGRAKIPDELLKVDLPLVALACTQFENKRQVIARETFKIFSRPKPEYYVDSEDEPDLPDPDVPSTDIIFDGGVVL